jgi:hypothetical protein
MQIKHAHQTFAVLDRTVLTLIAAARAAAKNADCFDTNEPTALRLLADLVELRFKLMGMERDYFETALYTELSDEDIINIVRLGETV